MLNLILPASYAKEIDQNRLGLALRETLRHQNINEQSSVTLRLTNNRLIRQYNLAWLGVDAATDVLSFENAYTDPESGEHYLGDILISFEKARNQARLGNHSLQDEIEMLFVHGLLHIAGHDHDKKETWERMNLAQDAILEKIGNPLRGSIQY